MLHTFLGLFCIIGFWDCLYVNLILRLIEAKNFLLLSFKLKKCLEYPTKKCYSDSRFQLGSKIMLNHPNLWFFIVYILSHILKKNSVSATGFFGCRYQNSDYPYQISGCGSQKFFLPLYYIFSLFSLDFKPFEKFQLPQLTFFFNVF